MSDRLDLPQTETLLRAHYAQANPGALRPAVAARIRTRLEASKGGPSRSSTQLRLDPVRVGPTAGRQSLSWPLAVAAVIALLVVTWLAAGRLSTPPVAGSPSAALSAVPSAPAVASGSVPVFSSGPSAAGSEQRAIAFSDRQHGIVVGEYQGQGAIWTTADEGQTWTSQLVSAPPLDSVAVLGTRAWASAACVGAQDCTPAVLTSDDGGTTWKVIATMPAQSLAFPDATHGFAVNSTSNALLATDDGGVTWSPFSSPCEAYDVLVGVSFTDVLHGWAACDSGGATGSSSKAVLATDDGGVTWHARARVRLDGTRALGQIPTTGSLRGIQMLASGTGLAWLRTDGGNDLIRTTDGGVTWATVPIRPTGSHPDVPSAAIAPDGSLFALTVDAASGNGSATFNLGLSEGRDWKPYGDFAALPAPGTTPTPEPTSPPQAAIADSGVAFFDADNGIAIGNDTTHSYVWRTADGGKTWATKPLGKAVAALDAVFGSRAWITVSTCPDGAGPGDPSCTSVVERSDDRGATWNTVAHLYLRSISFADSTHGFGVGPYVQPTAGNTVGGAADGVFATTDGGATWHPVNRPQPCGVFDPTSVSFVSATHGWLGCEGQGGAGQGPKGVMETTDAGATWTWRSKTDIGGASSTGSIPSSDYLDTISMQPDGSGFMTGLRGSTFRTTDGGRTWTTCPPGEFDAFVTSQASIVPGGPWFLIQSGGNISPDPTATVARLMRSDNRGASWTRVGGYLPNP